MKSSHGYVLVAVLLLGTIVMLMIFISANFAMRAANTTVNENRKTQAFYAAQSGMERSIAVLNAKLVSPPSDKYTNLAAAQWLATQINNLQGTLPDAGKFMITATATQGATASDPATLEIYSDGTAKNEVNLRRIVMRFPVNRITPDLGPLVKAPAAITLTGTSMINGSAPVTGENITDGSTHHMKCPASLAAASATCTKSSTNPDAYTFDYTDASGVPFKDASGNAIVPATLKLGQTLRPTSSTLSNGRVSEERYIVTKKDKGQMEVTVLSDYIRNSDGTESRRTFSSTGDIPMYEENGIPAVLMPPSTNLSTKSANVAPICDTYACEHYTISPDNLFKLMMGGTKAEIEEKFKQLNAVQPGTYHSGTEATCSGPAMQWIKPAGGKLKLNECSPQIIIVDTRGMGTTDITIDNKETFHGLLYVLSDLDKEVRIASNGGINGASIIDNGNGGLQMTGTGNFADCGKLENKVAKSCYDSGTMNTVAALYQEIFKIPSIKIQRESWAEVGQ